MIKSDITPIKLDSSEMDFLLFRKMEAPDLDICQWQVNMESQITETKSKKRKV